MKRWGYHQDILKEESEVKQTRPTDSEQTTVVDDNQVPEGDKTLQDNDSESERAGTREQLPAELQLAILGA